jgi:nucleotide-binding universal stress UspA family protein
LIFRRPTHIFANILHANDGSEAAFRAFGFALALAKQNQSELHIVCVEELPDFSDFIEEVEQTMEAAARRFERVLERARDLAGEQGLKLDTHVFAGHPVRDIVKLAADLKRRSRQCDALRASSARRRLF